MPTQLSIFRPALVLFVLLSLITGVVYPLAITGIAQVAFPDKANGSIITDAAGDAGGRPLGSSLIGQEFGTSDAARGGARAKWFWGRPSATGPVPYTALNLGTGTGSSGSNLAPTNPALLNNIKARLAALDAADASVGIARTTTALGATDSAPAQRATAVPVDLVTSSASGLDPHISPAAAEYQVPRVAKARGLTEDAVRTLVREHTQGRALGVLGEPVVNVLTLNRALDAAASGKEAEGRCDWGGENVIHSPIPGCVEREGCVANVARPLRPGGAQGCAHGRSGPANGVSTPRVLAGEAQPVESVIQPGPPRQGRRNGRAGTSRAHGARCRTTRKPLALMQRGVLRTAY